jgi:hypothetical protein
MLPYLLLGTKKNVCCVIYTVTIFDSEFQITIDELIDMLNEYHVDHVKEIYYTFDEPVRFALKDYYKQRMADYLGL